MKVEQVGSNLVITIPMRQPATLSASGKSRIVATSLGNVKTDVMVEGKPLVIGVNAYVAAQ